MSVWVDGGSPELVWVLDCGFSWDYNGFTGSSSMLGGVKGWRQRNRAAYKHIIDFLSNGETLVLLGCNGSIH